MDIWGGDDEEHRDYIEPAIEEKQGGGRCDLPSPYKVYLILKRDKIIVHNQSCSYCQKMCLLETRMDAPAALYLTQLLKYLGTGRSDS